MNKDELNLSICSYNLMWKAMINQNLEAKNILLNIYYVHNYYNPDIYCFQEVVNPELILNIYNKKEFNSYLGFSDPEFNLTIWNKTKLKRILVKEGEFERGRPFVIILFYDKIRQNHFLFINIHAGHNKDTKKSIFEPINNTIDKISSFLEKYEINRVIVVGDFNREMINELNSNLNNKLSIKVLNKKYTFKIDENKNKTCCSLVGYGHKYNYDQVIDSYKKPIITKTMNTESWYANPSSDHIMIISILKNII